MADDIRRNSAKKCVTVWLHGGTHFPRTMRSGEKLSMNTSREKPFLSEVLDGEKIPLGTLSYFRERFRDRLYDLVMEEFLVQDAENGLTRAEVARRIGRRPEQITRWFAAPGNWTLETVSDLLLAISKSEPEVNLLPLEGRATRNYRGEIPLAPLPSEPGKPLPSASAIEANYPEGPSARARTMVYGQKHPAGALG